MNITLPLDSFIRMLFLSNLEGREVSGSREKLKTQVKEVLDKNNIPYEVYVHSLITIGIKEAAEKLAHG